MPIGTSGVSDYANTTGGVASGVTALYGIGAQGVSCTGGVVPPPTANSIITESGAFITAENGDFIVTEQ